VEPHKRRPAILQRIKEHGEVRIDDLADRLEVSPNTIRNDLQAMEVEGLIRRVRGGAVGVEQQFPVTSERTHPAFAARMEENRRKKEKIGRWAANLVRDGDAIALDASTSVYHLAAFLKDRRNLTVITNGLEVALLLARNPSNKVILAANTVSTQGLSLIGELPSYLKDGFSASCFFLSCSALCAEQGLWERSVDDATVKAALIGLSQEIVALVDSTKFGNIDTARFTGLDRLSHLVTDSELSPDMLSKLRQVAGFPITLVGDSDAETLSPLASLVNAHRYRIGFANMTEKMTFARQVRRGLEAAANRLDNVELVTRDNEMDRATALANADWFVDQGMDLVIEYQIDAQAGNVIMDKFNRAGIPVIAVDIPMPGAAFFGADNYRAGHIAGEALGRWVKDNWEGKIDILLRLEAPRVGSQAASRLQGLQDGVEAIIGPIGDEKVVSHNSPVIVEEAEAFFSDLPASLPTDARIAVVAINDDAALGALAAFERAGRLSQVAAVGQNADFLGRQALRRNYPSFIGSTQYSPESYGEQLISLALKMLKGQPVPPAVYSRHVFITRENIDYYYPAPDIRPEGI
jgi:ribose transport system substrate-binding protein